MVLPLQLLLVLLLKLQELLSQPFMNKLCAAGWLRVCGRCGGGVWACGRACERCEGEGAEKKQTEARAGAGVGVEVGSRATRHGRTGREGGGEGRRGARGEECERGNGCAGWKQQ